MPNWTKQQQRAIETPGNLIVSAAAGAGKTAVLTERLSRIVQSGTPVDALLVLTFTRAAAAEMKQRMERALRRAAAEEADADRRAYLRAQAGAVSRACISTIDAFCARVLRRHGHLIDLPPSARVLDELETPVLTDRVKEELLTDCGRTDDADWKRLLRCFGGEDAAWEAVFDLFTFLQSQPDPRGWLETAVGRYQDAAWRESLLLAATVDAERELSEALSALRDVRDGMPPSWAGPIGCLDEDLLSLNGALIQRDYDSYRLALCGYAPGRLTFPKGTEEAEKADVKAAREAVKKLVKQQCAAFSRTAAEEDALLERTGGVLESLARIVSAFTERYDLEKRRIGVLDYADLEHFALEILKNESVAAEYRERFSFIAVDEYQDSNRLQEALLNAVRREDNLFFVGDVKQSIYRFRQAEPSLFLEKLTAFDGTDGMRIDLTDNFRSAPEVLDAVNDVFTAILRRETGDLDYDARARLVAGRMDLHGSAELHLIERDDAGRAEPFGADGADEPDGAEEGTPGEEDTAAETAETALEDALDAEVEARLVAARIRRLMAEDTIYDRETGGERPLRYSDFAILLRTSGEAEHIAATLAQAGIPCYAQMSGGYFDSIEVMLALNCLRVIDNRRQDIPLLSVLRAVSIAGAPFSAEDLAHIRMRRREGSFFDALEAAAGGGDALARRVRAFLDRIEYWQRESVLQPIDRLIARLLDDTGLYARMGACTGGAQRQANLDALLFRARVFEQGAERGVNAFLRFMERAGQSNARLGAAQQVGADAVRVLTVHRSKGLEYPVVFLCQLGRQLNRSDERRSLVLHGTAGIGLKWIEDGVWRDTAARRAIVRRQRREQLAEEMRVLYVGMTRAEKRLILIGSAKRAARLLEQAKVEPTAAQVLAVKTLLQWTLMGTRRHCKTRLHRREEYLTASEADASRRMPDIPAASDAARERLRAHLSWTYPYSDSAAVPAKAGASAIARLRAAAAHAGTSGAGAGGKTISGAEKSSAGASGKLIPGAEPDRPLTAAARGAMETSTMGTAATEMPALDGYLHVPEAEADRAREDESAFVLPAFAARADAPGAEPDRPLTAAARGTVVHAVLSRLPIAPLSEEQVARHVDGLAESGMLTKQQAACVPAEQLAALTQSPLWARMASSARVERELPFSHLVDAAALYGESAGDERVLLQGVIDCCFLTDDGWVLLDYKTDRLRRGVSLAEMAAEHIPQLDLYAAALEALTAHPVVERYVVLLSAGRSVRV